jgi:hypothetical protein
LLGSSAQVDGFGISLGLCPPQSGLPLNVTLTQSNVFDPLADGLEEKFDVNHIPLLILGLSKHEDPGALLQKFKRMLSN